MNIKYEWQKPTKPGTISIGKLAEEEQVPTEMVKTENIDEGTPSKVSFTWHSRRWMAWICLGVNLLIAMLVLFTLPMDRLAHIQDTLHWIMLSNVGIIIAYMFSTAWVAITGKKKH